MSFVEHAVTAPAGEREVVLVRLRHSTWATALRYADDVVDWTVTDEESNVVTFTATGVDADGEPTDETGIDSRGVALPDALLILRRRLETLSKTGNSELVEVTVYRYTSDDLTAPATEPAVLAMAGPSSDSRIWNFEASNANTVNRDAPPREFTYSGNPGLRR